MLQAYVKRTGQYLCSMSWEGYEGMGRGAIFANYDDAESGGMPNDVGVSSALEDVTRWRPMSGAQSYCRVGRVK